MCTLAWGQAAGGLWVCFNRDEQRGRPLAEPPRTHSGGAFPMVYARDPHGGGTWFAASAGGFAIALLNNYPAMSHLENASLRSRGRLVVELAESSSAAAALKRLTSEDLSLYAPFYVFILSDGLVEARDWDGSSLIKPHTEGRFWTTSSYKPEEVRRWREAWWSKQGGDELHDPDEAAHLMRECNVAEPAFGLTMDREDARSLSQIELVMKDGTLSFSYRPRELTGYGYESPVRVTFP